MFQKPVRKTVQKLTQRAASQFLSVCGHSNINSNAITNLLSLPLSIGAVGDCHGTKLCGVSSGIESGKTAEMAGKSEASGAELHIMRNFT